MSQHHFKDDPHMGRRYLIENEEWEITDVWIDIAKPLTAPRNVTLDQVYGEDFGLYMSVEEVDKLTPIGGTK